MYDQAIKLDSKNALIYSNKGVLFCLYFRKFTL